MVKKIKTVYLAVLEDPLYGNSVFLMLSTVVLSILGFVFWIINARLFDSDQVGLATSLWSIVSLISGLSLLGFDAGLIRFLPKSRDKNEKINTVITSIILASTISGLIYFLFINTFTPRLAFIKDSFTFSLFVILVIAVNSLSNITEIVFIAYRSARQVLVKSVLFSFVKLGLPIFFVLLGVYGIILSIGLALLVGTAYGFFVLIQRHRYQFKLEIRKDIVKKMFDFSFGNFVASFISGLPTLMLPVIILNSMGPSYSAFFYMDKMVANFLYIIPIAVSQSLLAEGSHSEKKLRKHLFKSAKIVGWILIPAIIFTLLFGGHLLHVFGREYSDEGLVLLQILAISGVFVAITAIGSTVLKIKHKLRELVFINTLGSVSIFLLSYFWFPLGLSGVGYAWLASYMLMSVAFGYLWVKR